MWPLSNYGFFWSQFSWTCYLIHKDWIIKHRSLDRCCTGHKSQHSYLTIILIFLFSQLLPACFLLGDCFLPWEIKWIIAKSVVLWRVPSSKLFPLVLQRNRRKDRVNPTLSWILCWEPVICIEVLFFRKLCSIAFLGWVIWVLHLFVNNLLCPWIILEVVKSISIQVQQVIQIVANTWLTEMSTVTSLIHSI